MKAALAAALISLTLHSASAQEFSPAKVYTSNFNSSFKLTASQIQSAQLDSVVVESLENLMSAEKSQLAFGGPDEDDFYTLPLPTNTTSLKPGQILKVQPVTDTSAYALPPNTALSRIIYTTTNLNGTLIPASGFILWPFIPRTFPHVTPAKTKPSKPKANLIVWTHGTSGVSAPNAPSSHRYLWYAHTAPFALAQAGYAVFAPDYAGLGVRYTFDGKTQIPHQYLAAPAGAHDALYGLRATLSAFPDNLSRDWIIMGHSQGGGVSWSAAEILASQSTAFKDLLAGYKGTISLSPVTQLFKGRTWVLPLVGQMMTSIFPDFSLSEWLTPLGAARTELLRQIEGEFGVLGYLFTGEAENQTLRSDFFEASYHAEAFSKLADPGRRDFKGPMLVLQGREDLLLPEALTTQTVEETQKKFPRGHDLEYVVAEGVGHTPILDATRYLWMGWIEDRFAGRPLVKKGWVRSGIESFLEYGRYAQFSNSVPLWAGLAEYSYLVALSL